MYCEIALCMYMYVGLYIELSEINDDDDDDDDDVPRNAITRLLQVQTE